MKYLTFAYTKTRQCNGKLNLTQNSSYMDIFEGRYNDFRIIFLKVQGGKDAIFF